MGTKKSFSSYIFRGYFFGLLGGFALGIILVLLDPKIGDKERANLNLVSIMLFESGWLFSVLGSLTGGFFGAVWCLARKSKSKDPRKNNLVKLILLILTVL